jgi:hypothetical protein
MSENFRTATSHAGTITVESISKSLGTEITTLAGMDILSKYNILFDYKKEEILFSKQNISLEGDEVGISSLMGALIVELTVNSKKMRFFLDTGAKISYLPDKITCNYEKMGIKEDFYPGFGTFQTPYYQIETGILDKKFTVQYGNLPALLQQLLVLGGVNGIIGFDFFDNFRVLLNVADKKLVVACHNSQVD